MNLLNINIKNTGMLDRICYRDHRNNFRDFVKQHRPDKS
jgi:hypothetical protein